MPSKQPLSKFTQFTDALLPHETEYLLTVQRFEDPERLETLKLIDFNCRNIDQFTPYDAAIDKRKYNHLQNWIKDQLNAIDVDERYRWKLEMERKIMTDTIQAKEEKSLIKAIRRYEYPTFNFMKFYELVTHYNQFLLIRIRQEDQRLTEAFLAEHEAAYLHAKSIYTKIQQITKDIIEQYSSGTKESRQWEKWLNEVFYDEYLDGYNRILALVRLVFIASNYRNFELVKAPFEYLGAEYAKGRFYSKRNLLNYYSNCLLMYSNYREYDLAIFYGRLSVRAKNHDYIFYTNNLCAVLLRQNKNQEALQLMKAAAADAKATKNFHSRIGFVAFYMQAMIKNELLKNAESYGDTFIRAFAKQILSVRWHLFFSIYLRVMLQRGVFEKALKTVQKYKLLALDKTYSTKPNYLPIIPLCYEIARYREGLIDDKRLIHFLETYDDNFFDGLSQTYAFSEMEQVLRTLIPEIMHKLRKTIFNK